MKSSLELFQISMILDWWYVLLVSFILGIVEGLTEFLPVSSTVHMMFVGMLLGLNSDDGVMMLLNIIIQLGAIFSIVVVFWKDVFILLFKKMYLDGFKCFNRSYLSFSHIVLGVIPIILLGLFFYEYVKSVFEIEYMIYSLVSGGVLLLLAEWCTRRFYVKHNVSDIDNLSYLQAFLIGCFQCLSLCPGFSRSGATISGGLLVGVNRYVSSMFSFLLAVPMIFSAAVLVIYKNFSVFTVENFPVFLVGFLSAFFTSLCTVKIFIRMVQCVSFVPFAIYRFVLAIILYFIL